MENMPTVEDEENKQQEQHYTNVVKISPMESQKALTQRQRMDGMKAYVIKREVDRYNKSLMFSVKKVTKY